MASNLKLQNLAWVILIIVILVAGALGYFYYQTLGTLKNTKLELDNTKITLTESEGKVAQLANELDAERYKNSLFTGQISDLASTVGKLDKLSKTDKELLQKYSKVYFLNEHY